MKTKAWHSKVDLSPPSHVVDLGTRDKKTAGNSGPRETRQNKAEDKTTRGCVVEMKLGLLPLAGMSSQRGKTRSCSGKQLN